MVEVNIKKRLVAGNVELASTRTEYNLVYKVSQEMLSKKTPIMLRFDTDPTKNLLQQSMR